jgi:hypothetical protein
LHSTSGYDATLFYSTDASKKQEPEWGPDGQIGIVSSPADACFFETMFGYADETNHIKEHYNKPDAQGAIRSRVTETVAVKSTPCTQTLSGTN